MFGVEDGHVSCSKKRVSYSQFGIPDAKNQSSDGPDGGVIHVKKGIRAGKPGGRIVSRGAENALAFGH